MIIQSIKNFYWKFIFYYKNNTNTKIDLILNPSMDYKYDSYTYKSSHSLLVNF